MAAVRRACADCLGCHMAAFPSHTRKQSVYKAHFPHSSGATCQSFIDNSTTLRETPDSATMADTQTPNSREMAAGMELKEQLIRELEQFYDDGNAFFTKQAMRDIAVQLGAESSESDKGTMAKDLKGEPHFFRKPKNRSMDLKDEPDRKLVKYE